MTYSQYDVVIVPFPFTDRGASRPRPAIIVSSDAANRAADVAIMAMITRIDAEPWYRDQPLQNIESAGVEKPCKMRMKLFSIDLNLIRTKTGTLGEIDRKALRKAMREVFTL